MDNDIFKGVAEYGNTPPPNSPGTMAMPALNQVSGSGSGFLSGVDKFLSAVNPYAGLINGGLSMIGNLLNRGAERKEAQRERDWNEAMMDKQNAWSLEQWNRTNEYNSPAEQVKRMREAGLNPMYYGLDGSSANAFQSAQALGYSRASLGSMENPFEAGIQGMMASKNLQLAQTQIEKTEAEKNQIEASTSEKKLDAEFKEKTMQYRVEGERLANDLTKEQISKIGEEKKQIVENIKKIIAETETESARKLLVQAEEHLRKMEAKQIAELLPLQKAFVEAQTSAQKAQASLTFAEVAIKKGLLDAGYIDYAIDQMWQETRMKGFQADKAQSEAANAEAVRLINEFKAAIRTGHWSEAMGTTHGNSWIARQTDELFNALFGMFSSVSEAIAGPLSGFVK